MKKKLKGKKSTTTTSKASTTTTEKAKAKTTKKKPKEDAIQAKQRRKDLKTSNPPPTFTNSTVSSVLCYFDYTKCVTSTI